MKNKFKVGQAVIEKDTGHVYFVYQVLLDGFICVQDEYHCFLDERDSNEFELYNPRKDV